jgi:general secretion pathway protein D
MIPIKRAFWVGVLSAFLFISQPDVFALSPQDNPVATDDAQASVALPTPLGTEPKPSVTTETLDAPETIGTTETTPDLKTEKRIWNLRDADVLSVIDEVSRQTGKNFIVDPRVHGKVTVVATHALSSGEIYQAFLSMLQVLGYAATENGKVVKIVPVSDIKQNGVALDDPSKKIKGDEAVVQVFLIKHGSALQLVPILRPLLPQWADVAAYRPANSVIVTGTAQAVKQVGEIIDRLDGRSGEDVDVVKLQYAGASQLVATLNYLEQANHRNGSTEGVSLAADDSTNTILVSGTAAARLQTQMLIQKLDKQPNDNVGNIEVVYLHYLQANKLAKILGGGQVDGAGDSTPKLGEEGQLNTPATPYSGDDSKSRAASTNTEFGEDVLPDLISANGSVSPWGKDVFIRAEPATNALIIKAPPTIMRSIKNVIARLDVRPAQVLVQAIIVEMSNGTLQQLGVQWGTVGTAAIPSESSTSGDQPIATAGSAFESITGGLGLGVMRFGTFKSLISVLEQDNASDILSTPSLVVLDNQKAEIRVGKQVSIVNGSYAGSPNTSGNVNPYTTTSQEDIGLTLDVIPQINQGNAVRLTLVQKNATLDGARVINSNPVTNNTLIKTSVIVNDGDILVLGGLTTKELSKTLQKIPVLGDIPLLGHLFKHSGTSLEKKNLMIFLKPTIVRNNIDASTISFQKYEMIRDAQWDRIKALHEEKGSDLPLLSELPQKDVLPTPFGG